MENTVRYGLNTNMYICVCACIYIYIYIYVIPEDTNDWPIELWKIPLGIYIYVYIYNS
jgi:hypothetical protein